MTKEEIIEALMTLPGWALCMNEKAIMKQFSFTGFADAMAFANNIAIIADKENHHPDLLIMWGKVEVTLTTHDAGGMSQKDLAMAHLIEALGYAPVKMAESL